MTRRRPRWLPALATLAVLPILLYLGFWQLDRAETKRDMFERFGAADTWLPYAELANRPPADVRYRTVVARGRYDGTRQFLLEGMTHEGRPGVHVLTPLSLADGGVLMVDRGWMPDTARRDEAPDIPVDETARSVRGRLVPFPRPGMRLGEAEPARTWPRRVVYPTPEEVGGALGATVQPHLLWLDATEPDGFVRDWKPAEFGPARHIGYAVQWFGLAVTLVMIYILLNFRRKGDRQQT